MYCIFFQLSLIAVEQEITVLPVPPLPVYIRSLIHPLYILNSSYINLLFTFRTHYFFDNSAELIMATRVIKPLKTLDQWNLE